MLVLKTVKELPYEVFIMNPKALKEFVKEERFYSASFKLPSNSELTTIVGGDEICNQFIKAYSGLCQMSEKMRQSILLKDNLISEIDERLKKIEKMSLKQRIKFLFNPKNLPQ